MKAPGGISAGALYIYNIYINAYLMEVYFMNVLLIGAYVIYFSIVGGVAFVLLSLLAHAGIYLIISAYEKFFDSGAQK